MSPFVCWAWTNGMAVSVTAHATSFFIETSPWVRSGERIGSEDYSFPPPPSALRLGPPADRLPRRAPARDHLRIEARLAQREGGAAGDMEPVGAEDRDRLVLLQLADPLGH